LIHTAMIFRNRTDAGEKLAERLTDYADRGDVLVLALPRGGVPVAYEVAYKLNAPLDVFLVRKLGVPGHEELAMGAIASGGVRVLNDYVVNSLRIPASAIDEVAREEQMELERREQEYRDALPPPEIAGKTVILVDDGLATGSTMKAAAVALRKLGPAKIVVAVPVSAPSTCEEFESEVDSIICAATPEPFYGVGMWYSDFSQTSDKEVRELLGRSRAPSAKRMSGNG
jgi:putative phosphoribosyl transferase